VDVFRQVGAGAVLPPALPQSGVGGFRLLLFEGRIEIIGCGHHRAGLRPILPAAGS